MDNYIKAWLYDILQAINEIDSFLLEETPSFENYPSDVKTKRAVERNLEIIGEAMNRIKKTDANFEISDANKIIATRNKIIHSYDDVSDEMIWSIVVTHLPVLRHEIELLLNE